MFLGPGSRYRSKAAGVWRAIWGDGAAIGNIGVTLTSTDVFVASGNYRTPTVVIGPTNPLSNEIVNLVGPSAGGVNINIFCSSFALRQAAIQSGTDADNPTLGGEIRLYTTSSGNQILKAISIDRRGQVSIGVASTGGLSVGSTNTIAAGVSNANVGFLQGGTAPSSLQTFLRSNGTVFASTIIAQADITLYAHANLRGL